MPGMKITSITERDGITQNVTESQTARLYLNLPVLVGVALLQYCHLVNEYKDKVDFYMLTRHNLLYNKMENYSASIDVLRSKTK